MLPNQQREPRMDYTTSFTSFVVGHQAHRDTDGCVAEGERQTTSEEVERQRQRQRKVQLAKGDAERGSECGETVWESNTNANSNDGKHTHESTFLLLRNNQILCTSK